MSWKSDAYPLVYVPYDINTRNALAILESFTPTVSWEWPLGLFYDTGPEETVTLTFE